MHYAPIRSQLMTPFSEPIIMQAHFTARKGSFHPEGYIMIRRMMQDPRTDLIRSSSRGTSFAQTVRYVEQFRTG